jgi:serine/threonine protein kinase/RecA/RadA recombinase
MYSRSLLVPLRYRRLNGSTQATHHLVNNRYLLGGEPRKGGMAKVFSAVDMQEDQQRVAVKMISTPSADLANKIWDREYRALRRLEHPNIVRLLDGGREEGTGRRFLVFEWIEDDLDRVLSRGEIPAGWDDFIRKLGKPLFTALATAHDANVAHRDIKPANILLAADGTPKLADFGIAKIVSDISLGMTVADFRSKPFAAPLEEGAHRYTAGDVYSLGVTALAVLSGVNARTSRFDEDPRLFVDEAFAAIDAPDEAIEFLRRCTALKIADRPRNGGVALAELDALTQRREEAARKHGFKAVPTCYLSLSARARENLVADLDLESEQAAEAAYLADLTEGVSLLSLPAKGSESDGKLYLLGSEIRSVVEPIAGSPRLRVHNARLESGSFLDRDRARAWTGRLTFSLAVPPDFAAAEADLSEILDAVLAVGAEQRRANRQPRDQKVIARWRRSLQALAEIERSREKPLDYAGFEAKGGRVVFKVDGPLGEDLVGQMRIAELIDGSLLAGQISSVAGSKLQMRVDQGDPKQLPLRGRVKVDQRLGQVALRRQESTLDALQRGAISRPELEGVLVDPGSAAPPVTVPEPEWCQEGLDAPKRAAVRAALGSSDVLLIEGPPGTGKTTLIVELIAQELKRDPNARILLSSQTHSALDNVLERLDALDHDRPPRMLRVGRSGDERIADGVGGLLIEPQLKSWRGEVIESGRGFLRDWAKENQISVRYVEIAMRLDELASLLDAAAGTAESLTGAESQLEALRDTRRSGGSTSNETISDVQDRIGTLRGELENMQQLKADLIRRLRELNADVPVDSEGLDAERLREMAAKAVDQSHPGYERCTQFVHLLGDWHARFGRGAEFETAALVRAQVVAGTCVGLASVSGWENIEFDLCIVDEASKANATEALIPMSRADRWVLVGDHRQLPPHLDEALLDHELMARFELSEEDLRETLFERLRDGLPDRSRVTLSEQHRMDPAIGDLISHCFYDGELKSAPGDPPQWLSLVLPTPVRWLSTSGLRGRAEERVGFGRTNPLEARWIRELLGSLNFVAAGAKKRISVAILTGYRGQAEEISRQIAQKLPECPALDVECSTVDAFQGREADIAIYSVTRSNVQGTLGFLAEQRRLNVALSRGRHGLVIVGDDEFAYSASGDNPFRKVLDYIEADEGCSIERRT